MQALRIPAIRKPNTGSVFARRHLEALARVAARIKDYCSCGHREYDHDTPDGSCWKCHCKVFEAFG